MSEFDRTGTLSLDDLIGQEPPPEHIVQAVTPWRRAMQRILIGLALATVTIEIYNLNHILPVVGLLLVLAGFRALRRENGFFRACYLLSAVRFGTLAVEKSLLATIYWQDIFALPLYKICAVTGGTIALFALLFCFMAGLRMVEKKAERKKYSHGPAALLVWYAVLCVLALNQYFIWIVLILMLTVSAFILYDLYRLSKALDETGYALHAAPVRLPDWALMSVLIAIVLSGVVCGSLFFSRYPMEWTPVQETAETAEVAETKAELLALGFPPEVLNDLTDEDILSCKGAQCVVSSVSGYSDYRAIPKEYVHAPGYDCANCDLHLTDVDVMLPGDPAQLHIFHHFVWKDTYPDYSTHCLSIQLYPHGWQAAGAPSGRLLCNRDDALLTAPYVSSTAEERTHSTFFGFSTSTATDALAPFSLPKGVRQPRGYLTYSVQEVTSNADFPESLYQYIYPTGYAPYPVHTAQEYCALSFWDGPFRPVFDIFQFDPCYPPE